MLYSRKVERFVPYPRGYNWDWRFLHTWGSSENTCSMDMLLETLIGVDETRNNFHGLSGCLGTRNVLMSP